MGRSLLLFWVLTWSILGQSLCQDESLSVNFNGNPEWNKFLEQVINFGPGQRGDTRPGYYPGELASYGSQSQPETVTDEVVEHSTDDVQKSIEIATPVPAKVFTDCCQFDMTPPSRLGSTRSKKIGQDREDDPSK